jgi:hypothetical protein
MSLTLIKEDGSGLSNANSYASAADGDSYHDGHLYASAWTGAVTGTKEAALVMATRLLDSHFTFNGFRRLSTQALMWPRRYCKDPDYAGPSSLLPSALWPSGPYFPESTVPALVRDACCELARELIKLDRTQDPEGEGLKSFRLEGTMRTEFDPADRAPVVTRIVQAMLSKVGSYIAGRSGSVPVVRV